MNVVKSRQNRNSTSKGRRVGTIPGLIPALAPARWIRIASPVRPLELDRNNTWAEFASRLAFIAAAIETRPLPGAFKGSPAFALPDGPFWGRGRRSLRRRSLRCLSPSSPAPQMTLIFAPLRPTAVCRLRPGVAKRREFNLATPRQRRTNLSFSPKHWPHQVAARVPKLD